jgi:hypothetical protein
VSNRRVDDAYRDSHRTKKKAPAEARASLGLKHALARGVQTAGPQYENAVTEPLDSVPSYPHSSLRKVLRWRKLLLVPLAFARCAANSGHFSLHTDCF